MVDLAGRGGAITYIRSGTDLGFTWALFTTSNESVLRALLFEFPSHPPIGYGNGVTDMSKTAQSSKRHRNIKMTQHSTVLLQRG